MRVKGQVEVYHCQQGRKGPAACSHALYVPCPSLIHTSVYVLVLLFFSHPSVRAACLTLIPLLPSHSRAFVYGPSKSTMVDSVRRLGSPSLGVTMKPLCLQVVREEERSSEGGGQRTEKRTPFGLTWESFKVWV